MSICEGFPRLGTLPPKGHVLGFAVSGRATYFPVQHIEAHGFHPRPINGQELRPEPQREYGLSTPSRCMLRILTDAWQPCQPLSGNYHAAAQPIRVRSYDHQASHCISTRPPCQPLRQTARLSMAPGLATFGVSRLRTVATSTCSVNPPPVSPCGDCRDAAVRLRTLGTSWPLVNPPQSLGD